MLVALGTHSAEGEVFAVNDIFGFCNAPSAVRGEVEGLPDRARWLYRLQLRLRTGKAVRPPGDARLILACVKIKGMMCLSPQSPQES